ncbi:MAG: DUF3488 domain-containing protein [Halothiobacillaceae bacterium]|nr:MAG: DUF3488 domain-containing protein [Halothiobacillaceae bacterium]
MNPGRMNPAGESAPSPAFQHRLVMVLALVLAPHVLHMPPWISLLAGLGLLWKALHLRGLLPPPSRLTLVLLLGGGIAANWLTHGGIVGREGGVSFLMLLTALKLLETRNRRDAGITLLLGLFLLLTLFLFDQGPLTALWALAAFVLLLGLMTDLASQREPRSWREQLRRLAPTLGWTLPVALLLFVLVPRPSAPLFGLPQSGQATTGLSDELAPGSITDLSRSDEVAFRATFSGAEPARDELYWRGPVFWHFDGRRWTRQPDLPRPDTLAVQPGSRTFAYTLMLEPQQAGILPALDRPLDAPPGARMLIDQDLRFPHPQTGRQLIPLHSSPDARLDPVLPEGLRRQALRLPAGENPLLLDQGQRWQALPPRERIDAALRLFREQGYRYTLGPPALPDQDGMDAFLFDTRAGFCEHYATSFVLLMRAAGLPARVVTGYQGGERHPDGYWIVRQGDAHAWAEVWMEGEGWARVDPTRAIAPERIEQGLAAAVPQSAGELPAALRRDFGFLHRTRLQWDGLQTRWNRWVLGYSLDDQRRLLEALGWAGSVRWGLWGLLMIGLIALYALGRLLPRLLKRDSRTRHDKAWARFERLMGRAGIERLPGEGPRALIQRMERERPHLAPAMRSFIESYLDWRYAAPEPTHEARARMNLDALRTMLRKGA